MEPDARATKLLTDLLALSLTDSEAEAEAALGALRRRAARDGVTAGTIKQWLEALSKNGSLPATAPELRQLHEIIEQQRVDLAEARQGRQRSETSLARARHAEALLRDAEARAKARSNNWLMGLMIGVVLGGGAGWLAGRMAPTPAKVAAAAAPGPSVMTRQAWTRLAEFLNTCTMTSSNNMAGTVVRVHLLISVDGAGYITHAVVSPEQENDFATEEQRDYADMVARTLDGGSCGKLPLPARLTGRPVRLAMYLPR